jgi:cytochrome c-type biogenesis protein CcmH
MRKLALATIASLLLLSGTAHAQEQDRVTDLSRNIMSPFCPGLTLHDCPSDAAIELRQDILEMVQEGMSDEEIMNRLEQQYGPIISAVPDDGRSWLVWGLPAAALLGGGALAYLAGRRWTSRRRATPEPPAISTLERERIETELRSIRGLWSGGR